MDNKALLLLGGGILVLFLVLRGQGGGGGARSAPAEAQIVNVGGQQGAAEIQGLAAEERVAKQQLAAQAFANILNYDIARREIGLDRDRLRYLDQDQLLGGLTSGFSSVGNLL